jgi:hypothetical protein
LRWVNDFDAEGLGHCCACAWIGSHGIATWNNHSDLIVDLVGASGEKGDQVTLRVIQVFVGKGNIDGCSRIFKFEITLNIVACVVLHQLIEVFVRLP